MAFSSTKYKLMNCATGRVFEDEGWTIADPEGGEPALVRAVYEKRKFEVREDLDGFYQYANWLPIRRTLAHSHAPVTYKSKALASYLGLSNLYITFSGYFPKIGAAMETCSFKETEAYSVCARLPRNNRRILVVASAGNTARAFAKVCSDNRIPLVISIPVDNVSALWFRKPLNRCVKIITSSHGSDYFDAISLGDKLCTSPRYLAEGGAKNIARRDGMGTTLLSAVRVIGRIPDAYFQAVGSGTGAIAAWENSLRLLEDGRFGTNTMRIYASQNEPFTLMYDSWKAGTRDLVPITADEARQASAIILAKVLSNRKPPFTLRGGLFDALKESGGDMYKVSNDEVVFWKDMFRELEGVDIYSAAAVAVSSLQQAIADGSVKKDEVIMLNITGGGDALSDATHRKTFRAIPDLIIDADTPAEDVVKAVDALFD